MDQFLGVHNQVFKDRGVTHFSLAQTTGHDVDHPMVLNKVHTSKQRIIKTLGHGV